MAHTPEVLADLVARLRRAPTARALYQNPTAAALLEANAGAGAHAVDRADVEALIGSRCPPLELDRFATAVLCGHINNARDPL